MAEARPVPLAAKGAGVECLAALRQMRRQPANALIPRHQDLTQLARPQAGESAAADRC